MNHMKNMHFLTLQLKSHPSIFVALLALSLLGLHILHI